MNRKVWAVIRREYVTRAKTKGFVIGTLLFPAIMVLIFGGVFIVGLLFGPSPRTYAVVDESGMLYERFTEIQSDTLKNGEPKYRFVLRRAEGDPEALRNALQNQVIAKEIDGYLWILDHIVDSLRVTFGARSVSDFEEQSSFSRTLSWLVTNQRLEREGFDPRVIRDVMERGRVRMVSHQVTEKGAIEKSSAGSFILAYVLSYVMLLMIMGYGQITLRSVIEEKSQRITETIVASIRPVDLLMGKIVGVCALGLTQLAIFGGFMLILVRYATPLLQQMGLSSPELLGLFGNLQFSGPLFLFMLVFFLLGFVFYSALFAAVGAMVNSEDEGQQFQMPIIFVIMIAYFVMFSVAKNPESVQAFWVSLFPLFTPLVMFGRIAVTDPLLPSGTFLSMGTMLLFTAVLVYGAARIYRVGILMYGKKPSLKEALKWMRYK